MEKATPSPPLEAEDAFSLEDLPLDSLHQILSLLPAKDVLAAGITSKRLYGVATTDLLWNGIYARDFPTSNHRMAAERAAAASSHRPLPTLQFFRDRLACNHRWRQGQPVWSESLWEGHHGPVFGVTLLQDPLPSDYILSAGVHANQDPMAEADDGKEHTELCVWDISTRAHRCCTIVGPDRVPGGMTGDSGMGGLFHCSQIPKTTQVLCTSFDGDCFVLDLEAQARAPGSAAVAPSSPSARAPACDATEEEPHPDIRKLHPREFVKARLHRRLMGHMAPVVSGSGFNHGDHVTVATASFDGTIRLSGLPPVDPADSGPSSSSSGMGTEGVRLLKVFSDQPASPALLLGMGAGPVHVSSCYHAGNLLFSGHNDCVARVWDIEHHSKPLELLTSHQGWVWCILPLRKDEQHLLVTGATDSRVMLWDRRISRRLPMAQATLITTGTSDLSGPVAGLAVKPDTNYVVTNSFDGNARILDMRMGLKVLSEMEMHYSRGTRVDCDDDKIVTASFDATLKLTRFR